MHRFLPPFASVALSIAAAAAAQTGPAQTAKPIVTLGAAESVFVPREGVAFPLTLATRKCERLAVRVTRLAVGARQLPTDRLTAVILPGDSSGPATLVLRDSTAPAAEPAKPSPGCPQPPAESAPPRAAGALMEQGEYRASLSVTRADGSAPVEFAVQFKKPPAALKADVPLRLERVLRWPFEDRTNVATLFETSGVSDLHLQPPPYRLTLIGPGTVTASLTPPTPAEPTPPNAPPEPIVIPAGESRQFELSFDGDRSVGTYGGALTVRAAELSGGALSVPVELAVRRSRAWLLLLIVVGLLAGYILRTVLESRRKLAESLVGAHAALGRLHALHERPLDSDETAGLAAIRQRLEEAIDSPSSKPAKIDAAVTQFNAELDAKLKEMAERRAKAATELTQWASVLAESHDQPADVPARLKAFEAETKAARDTLGAGLSKPAEEVSAKIREALAREIVPAISNWLTIARKTTDGLPEWPEVAGAKPAKDRTVAAFDAIAAVPSEDAASFAAHLRQSSRANRAVRGELLGTRAELLNEYSLRLAAEVARRGLAADLAEPVAAAEGARIALLAAAAQGANGALDSYRRTETNLLDAWRALILAAGGKADNPALGEHRFLAALEAVPGPSAAFANALQAPKRPPAAAQTAEEAAVHLRPGVEDALLGHYRIAAPSFAWLGEPVELSLIPLREEVALPIRVRWILGTQERLATPSFIHHPTTPGTLFVQALVEEENGPDHIAYATVEVMRRWTAEGGARAAATAKSIERVQTAVSAVLISVFGFAILGPTFIGSWDQMVTAFAWGFATDLGVAKVLDLASPVANTKLKAPAAA